jgi:serine/threonine protein kinase
MTSFDLRPYGISHKLKSKDGVGAILPSDLQAVYTTATKIRIGPHTFDVINELGRGTNGITYKCATAAGEFVAIKRLLNVNTNLMIRNFLTEAIMQIMLQHESAGQAHGPFVPAIYTIGYDRVGKEGYICSQMMRNTLKVLTDANTPAINDTIVPDAVKQVATILKFFGSRLEFNHRDLKGDNIMYVRDAANRPIFKLIDMGHSCLTWNGLKLTGSSYYGASACFKKDRDLAQLLLYLHNFTPNISPRLRGHIHALLQANVGGDHICNVAAGCPANGLTDWLSSYKFIDRANVRFERTSPNEASGAMNDFLHPPVLPVQSVVVGDGKIAKRICPSEKVYNPATGRCVKRTGAIGRRLPADSDATEPDIAPPARTCPADKIMNPATGRCVNRSGPIGRRLAKEQGAEA